MYKVIFFDFDGVILDSMPIRDYGFKKIVKNYPDEVVEKFIKYHQYNAGLSRFHKIRYFYNELLNKNISEEKVQEYANNFSKIMKEKLIDKQFLIEETIQFIKNNNDKIIMHIVSGSEQNELRYLCEKLEISQYFKSINGSPTHKNDLVKNILDSEQYNIKDCILIGDSINDYEAAKINGITFYGYNNEELRNKDRYIDSFKKGM